MLKVCNHRAHRIHSVFLIRKTYFIKRCFCKLMEYFTLIIVIFKKLVRAFVGRNVKTKLNLSADFLRRVRVYKYFLWFISRNFRKRVIITGKLCRVNIACGNIGNGKTVGTLVAVDYGEVIICFLVQKLLVHNRTRRYNADNLALYNALCQFRILDLLAYSNLVAALNELRDIHACAVKRYAAHRRAFRKAAVFTCERYFQLL